MSTYKRVILKLSGEALGENGRLFDQDLISHVVHAGRYGTRWRQGCGVLGHRYAPGLRAL